MTERPDNTRLHDWLDDTVGQTPDPVEGTRQVMSQVEETSQVGRWLPFPVFHRKTKAKAPMTNDTTDYQPSPIPASNGHTPTVIGRTTSMLSPVKAITAGALVFAIGGVLLIAQPFGQQATNVPASQGDAVSMDAAWVTGTLLHAPACTPPERTIDGDIVHEVGYRCESQIWETDDARLNGTATPAWNADVYRLGPDVSVSTGIYEVETDDGRWLCSSGPAVTQGSGLSASTNSETITCEGYDAYAGLAAVLNVDVDAGSVEGLVFSGEVPESPRATGL